MTNVPNTQEFRDALASLANVSAEELKRLRGKTEILSELPLPPEERKIRMLCASVQEAMTTHMESLETITPNFEEKMQNAWEANELYGKNQYEVDDVRMQYQAVLCERAGAHVSTQTLDEIATLHMQLQTQLHLCTLLHMRLDYNASKTCKSTDTKKSLPPNHILNGDLEPSDGSDVTPLHRPKNT